MLHKWALKVLFSMPSIVFAEASWYGSIRSGVEFGGGSDARHVDAGSRFGVKGSSEVAEGLTANYNFEHKISSSSASLAGGGRLSYVGLSGGFGTVTTGQIWSASYNSVGAITDNSTFYGSSGTSVRHGNVVSYAHSAGSVSFQVDLTMDGKWDSGGHIDKGEFGLTVGIGDLGKLAVAYTNQKDKLSTVAAKTSDVYYEVNTVSDPAAKAKYVKATPIMVEVAADDTTNVDTNATTKVKTIKGDSLDMIKMEDGDYSLLGEGGCSDKATDSNACVNVTAYAVTTTVMNSNTTSPPTGEHTNIVTTTSEKYYAVGVMRGGVTTPEHKVTMVDKAKKIDNRGHKSTHVAFEFGLGGITTFVGHSQKKMNGAAKKTKTTHFGARGALGDTGMSFLVQARNVKGADGMNSNPWLLGLTRSLGGGATVHFEHGNDDSGSSGSSAVALMVNF